VGEYIAFPVEEELHNFDLFNACNTGGIDEHLIYYDWLADSAMTSHITHQCNTFTTYTFMGNRTVMGVGGREVMIQGRGTIEVVLMCKECDYILLLENVLHVPGMWNNLIFMGCWDAAGGYYTGGGGTITLITKMEGM